MADVLTKKQRSYNMSRINCKFTKQELKIKPVMTLLGFSYQPKIYGHPDYALIKRKVAVFIDGCFWHRCPEHYKAPKTNSLFWRLKIAKNVQRDKAVNKYLRADGWLVIRIWEHSLKSLKI